jgi:hypothetical protein
VAVCTVLMLAASCTGSRPARAPSAATPTFSVSARPSAPPSPVVLRRLVLRADLSEKPARWRRVLFVPFGRRRHELGFKLFHESTNSQPSSFAVAGDGTFWIADRWKDRIAHYSVTGRFLGAIPVREPPKALSVGTSHERIRDVVLAGDEMYALLEPTGGPIVKVDMDGSANYRRPQLQGRSLWVAELLPSRGSLVMLVAGFVDPEDGSVEDGPEGYFGWDASGPPEPLLGIPADQSTWIDLQRAVSPSGGDQDFELRVVGPDTASVQPIHVDVLPSTNTGGRSLVAEVGPGEFISRGGDLLMFVMLTPSRPSDATRYGGGRWLLRLGRSALLWEPLPDPAIADEAQRRHVAMGPDGAIYLMVAKKRGVVILRRP